LPIRFRVYLRGKWKITARREREGDADGDGEIISKA
jgi:hypothetical protein